MRGGGVVVKLTAAVALVSTLIVASPAPALAVNQETRDTFIKAAEPWVSIDNAPSETGEPWTIWRNAGSLNLVETTGGLFAQTGPGWGYGIVAAAGAKGSVEVDVTFPSMTSPNTNGSYATVLFRGNPASKVAGGGVLRWSMKCGINAGSTYPNAAFHGLDRVYANATSGFGKLDIAQSVIATAYSTPAIPCGVSTKLKVTFDGGEYRGYVGSTLVMTHSDFGNASGAAFTNVGVGVGTYSGTNTAAGANFKNFLAVTENGIADGGDVPYYRCGRTIRDLGGGTYFVDLEAANDAYGGTQTAYTDKRMWWKTSWGVTADTPGAHASASKMTMALPPLSQMPPGGWFATFNVYRESGVQTLWGKGTWEIREGEFRDVPNLSGGPVIPMWAKAFDIESLNLPGWIDGTYTAEQYYGEQYARLPPTAVFVPGGKVGEASLGVVGTCTVRIDPTRPAAPETKSTTGPEPAPPPPAPGATTTTSTTSTTAPGATTTTTLPASGYDNQGEDGTRSDCSAGFLGRLPIIGGAFELVARLVCALKQILVELFVPNDWGTLLKVEEFSSKFPGSWVAEGMSGVGALEDSVSSGVGGSACGPVFQVPDPVAMTVAMPGPSGCNGAAATAGHSAAFDLFGFRTPIRAGLTVALYLGVVWRLIRLAPWSEGKDDGGPEFS